MSDSYIPFKKPGTITTYTEDQVRELARCSVDPSYFIDNYIKVQHPTRGAIEFEPYDYQRKIADSIHNYKDVIIMCGRQLGKCSFYTTIVQFNHIKIQLGSLLWGKLSFRDKIITLIQISFIKIKLLYFFNYHDNINNN